MVNIITTKKHCKFPSESNEIPLNNVRLNKSMNNSQAYFVKTEKSQNIQP